MLARDRADGYFAGAVCRADSSSEITDRPQPSEGEIQFILNAIAEYLTVEVCILSVLSGTCLCCYMHLHRSVPPGRLLPASLLGEGELRSPCSLHAGSRYCCHGKM